MSLVYYSIAAFGDARYERQWVQSIRSLRAYNKQVAVHLVTYNAVSDPVRREAQRQHVAVHYAGNYRDRVRELSPEHAEALGLYPTLHKIFSLRFLPAANTVPVLYLDCDTFFFGNVIELCQRYRRCHFYAREEPWSRRSHYGYQSSYLDENQLAETFRTERLAFIPPYNTGILMMNHSIASAIAQASGKFLHYAWRLLLGICEDEQLARQCNPALLREARRIAKRSNVQRALRYPSSNWWILEEIAMLLTLGGIPGLTHDALLRKDAAQNGEYAPSASFPCPIVVHYFSHLEEQFFAGQRRL